VTIRAVPEHDDTQSLLRLWLDGDHAAAVDLFERDRDWIEREIRKRRGAALRQLEETSDAIQELALRVLEYTPRFLVASRAQFRRLLARMISNLLADRGRSLASRPLPVAVAMTVSATDASRACLVLTGDSRSPAPPSVAARSEELGWIRIGLEFMPPTDRRLIHARTFEELDFTTAGAALGMSPDAARMRFHRGLLRLTRVVKRLRGGELELLLAEREAADATED